MNQRHIAIIFLTIATALITSVLGLTQDQVVSATIFSLFIYSTLLFWQSRLALAFLGISVLLIFGLLDVERFIEFASFDIIFFLVGMMTFVGFLERRHFFEYLIGRVIRVVGPHARKLIIVMMLMAGLSAALVDEVTSILIMTSMVLQLVSRYKLNPVPFVLMIVFATNIGSSATVVGNPVGVLIALRGGLSFTDFLRWATPISFISLLLCVGICMLYYKKEISALDSHLKKEKEIKGVEDVKAHNIPLCWALTIATLGLLILHTNIETLLHLHKNTMLIGAAFLSAGIALLVEGNGAKNLLMRRVDWWTLTFFALLFASVGTLQFVGTIDLIGNWLTELSGGETSGLLLIFTGATALLSPILDNVVIVAVFTPIVASLSEMGLNNFPIWWGMLFAGTFFGNLTMIGSTANIVAVGMLESRGAGKIGLVEWIKPGAVVAIPTLLLAITLVYLQLPLMPQ